MGYDIVGTMTSSYGVLALFLLLTVFALWRSGFFRRLYRVIEEMMFSNWQLALLGATAIALSLASGYTTFDGLRNFTSAPLLSVLIAFGIQGVMLIVAWLIGESFATGMNQQVRRGKGVSAREAVIGMGLGIALVGLVFYWVLSRYDAVGFTMSAGTVRGFHADWQRFADVALYFCLALVLLGLLILGFRRGNDISVPYVQSVRLIAKNAVLWVMLLASMSASVFFSFDSHFNAIFPAEARARAAEIRTLNQVAGIVADIGERAQKVQIAEAERLFETDGWKAYDAQLAKLALAARGAQAEIEAFFVEKMEERQRGIGEQQERIAGAERSQTALLRKRDELEAELQRIEPSIGALEAELAKAQTTYSETKQAIAAKRIDASAEDGGVEGTLKRGKGPVYRQRAAELDDLQRKLAITDEPRLKEARRQRDLASGRIVGLKREIATVVAEVAKYKGAIYTAEHRIKTAQAKDSDGEGGRIEPARVLLAFERARASFRQQPDTERLAALQARCGSLANAMSATPATKERVRSIDCDPKSAAEAAARVFALNAGLVAFQANCAGGSKLPQSASTDELLSFGRKCLQDSGLVTKEATDLGARLQSIEMNRDDKAHRFVVTWNAFLDGNRLGYLALVLAIGVDALVFMAGLFGAAAVKSPLSDVPSPKARSAEQLEAVIDTALLPHSYDNALLVLNAMEPIAPRGGYTQRIVLRTSDPHTIDAVRRVLNAGATIGAVRDVDGDVYELRGELFEHLSRVAKRAFSTDRRHIASAELERAVSVSLLSDIRANADIVLQYIHPIEHPGEAVTTAAAPQGFSVEIRLDRVAEEHKQVVRNALSAGATLQAVKRQTNDHYLVSSDFYRALSNVRARFLRPTGKSFEEPQYGGVLREHQTTVSVESRGQIDYKSAGASRRLLSHGRVSNGASNGAERKGTDKGLEVRFRNELMVAMGLSVTALDDIWQPEIAELALAAAAVLKRQARSRPALRNELRQVESDLGHTLEQGEEAIAARLDSDTHALALLRKLTAEIDHRIPALMLLPKAGLIEKLISALEEAFAGDGLSDEEHLLLSRLRKLKGDLERMNPKDTSHWRSIARQLERLTEPAVAPTHAAEDGKHH